MRLSKIKLAGFKSFVDPTTLPLPSNLVGIVGPNGCGKSNTIDAVRWVMGESSAKHLRGDSMADVIFNGSTGRKPVGQASIELIFDNSDGTLGGQYAQYAEIAVKRMVTRDGQSSYYLNGTRCRRRDITDIFLGTGLGPRSYAIIEQGTISRLIEARPEELRVFLEEAAGISKYKERRRETENRMRHTRENLDRLNDLRDELDKQLAHLQRQARTAERYQSLKQEERLTKGQLALLRLHALEERMAQHGALIGEQETALEAEIAAVRAAEAAIEHRREAQSAAAEQLNTVQARYYALGADIARLEQALQHGRERRRQQAEDLAQTERQLADVDAHLGDDARRMSELETSLAAEEPAAAEAGAAQEEAAAALAEAEQAMHVWQVGWEEFSQQSARPSQTAQLERARLEHLEQQQRQAATRRARLAEEAENLAAAQEDARLEALVQEREELEARREVLDGGLAEAQAAVAEAREQGTGMAAELDEARRRVQSLQGRRASLEALQQAALGKRKGAVNDWLAARGLEGAHRLAEALRVDGGWERAVEAVLGERLEGVVVEALEAPARSLDELGEGVLCLIEPARQGALPQRDGLTPLAERVRAPWSLAGLLGGIYCADSLDAALAARPTLAPHESLITPEAVWIGPHWLRVAQGTDERAGVLARAEELEAVAAEAEEAEARVQALAERLQQSRAALEERERAREAAQSELQALVRRLSELQSQESARRARREQIALRQERLRAELAELDEQLAGAQAEEAEVRSRLHAALAQMEEDAVQREQWQSRRETLRERLDEVRAQANAARERAHEQALRIQSMRTALQETRSAQTRLQAQHAHLVQRREQLARAVEEAAAPLAEQEQALDAELARRVTVEEELAQARARAGELDQALRELDAERQRAEQRAQAVREGLEGARLAAQELKVRAATLREHLDEAGHSPEALAAELPPEAEEAAWQARVEELAQRIQRLGPINLAAIDEYEQQSERKRYLDAQHADLSEALATLEDAIRKIDRETRTRFKETFDKVNSGLQSMFPRLFGGGHAYLELTGDDLLDTGVTVMARPPGKRNSTIHLLSGGEKALTAVALVFAIFELNPAPFCMLDEVDAPLDEANVGRFCTLVREMSERIQFIFISHNKATMEMAHHLMGVTMTEPGVSRLVAVDVEEAAELAAV
ncbi:chromosome segregation protein SMC [Ectothiorhodospiraceae bacterium 2226]|nr:chromosome segregation protein SMC [Ectothiorhodospiraceae bacterium 2226]